MKVKPLSDENGSRYGYSFLCPGCGNHHVIPTERPLENGAIWKFEGDVNNPTFAPSLLEKTGHYCKGEPQPPNCFLCNSGHNFCYICHSIITNGKINFCADSTHALAGQTVELPDIEMIEQ